jgi:ribulose-phosphate 3-epimerase
LTKVPLHVHLFVRRPADWIDPFADAGANIITVHQPERDLLARIRRRGCQAGLAISLDHPLTFIEGFDLVLLMATRIGIKGVEAEPRIYSRIRHMSSHLEQLGKRSQVKIVVDGGVRRETVPRFREAGADGVVPGSLVFGASDRRGVCSWLRSL